MAKCAECGFLAARNTKTQELVETDQNIRDTGVIQIVTEIKGGGGLTVAGPRPMYESPLCLIRTYDLRPEYGEHPNATAIKSAIDKDRECISFTQWIQGLTPKEHMEMINRKEMLEWQEKQEKRHSRDEWLRYGFLAVVTLVSVILGILLGHFIH